MGNPATHYRCTVCETVTEMAPDDYDTGHEQGGTFCDSCGPCGEAVMFEYGCVCARCCTFTTDTRDCYCAACCAEMDRDWQAQCDRWREARKQRLPYDLR